MLMMLLQDINKVFAQAIISSCVVFGYNSVRDIVLSIFRSSGEPKVGLRSRSFRIICGVG